VFYKRIKEKGNFEYFTLIYVSIYLSILLSITVFFLSYNASQLIYYLFEIMDKNDLVKIRVIVSIISFCSHMLISLTFLAYTKDLIFSFIMIYFLIGYFLSDIFLLQKAENHEKISFYVLISLNTLSFLYTLFNIKKKDFGITQNDDVNELILVKCMHKRSCDSD
jgi:hypothetical protein